MAARLLREVGSVIGGQHRRFAGVIRTRLHHATCFQQRDALGGDGFLAADRADALAGLGLQADLLRLDAEDVGHAAGGWPACGASSLGRWAKTMQSRLTICQPAAATASPGRARASRPSRGRGWPGRCRETSRRCRPARPRPAGRRSRRAAARRRRCGRPARGRAECRCRPAAAVRPGAADACRVRFQRVRLSVARVSLLIAVRRDSVAHYTGDGAGGL